LVGAAGFWHHFHICSIYPSLEYTKRSNRLTSSTLRAQSAARSPAATTTAYWFIDNTALVFNNAVDKRAIGFAHQPLLKLLFEIRVCSFGFRNNKHAGSLPIDAVH
jgi:hypothetical protein